MAHDALHRELLAHPHGHLHTHHRIHAHLRDLHVLLLRRIRERRRVRHRKRVLLLRGREWLWLLLRGLHPALRLRRRGDRRLGELALLDRLQLFE